MTIKVDGPAPLAMEWPVTDHARRNGIGQLDIYGLAGTGNSSCCIGQLR
jgi:lipid II:glycine glycyltransferase (peptidoglycan interpeptide bridge formation enzyme)